MKATSAASFPADLEDLRKDREEKVTPLTTTEALKSGLWSLPSFLQE